MNKQNILKVLEEANSVSSNLTDKQIEQYNSEEYKKGVSKGGKIVSNRLENKLRLKEIQKKVCVDGGKAMGKIQGKKNVESGLISSLGKQNSEFNNRIRTCPHCSITTRGIGYERWHGDKCKWKNKIKPKNEIKININEQINKCPHCSKEIKGRNYFKWHGNNCKFKK